MPSKQTNNKWYTVAIMPTASAHVNEGILFTFIFFLLAEVFNALFLP